MARTKVEIGVNTDTEIALMSRYGRKRELKTLVLNAIAEAVTLKTPWVKPAPKKRKSDGPECICGNDGKLLSANCPVSAHAADYAAQQREPSVLIEFDPAIHEVDGGDRRGEVEGGELADAPERLAEAERD